MELVPQRIQISPGPGWPDKLTRLVPRLEVRRRPAHEDKPRASSVPHRGHWDLYTTPDWTIRSATVAAWFLPRAPEEDERDAPKPGKPGLPGAAIDEGEQRASQPWGTTPPGLRTGVDVNGRLPTAMGSDHGISVIGMFP